MKKSTLILLGILALVVLYWIGSNRIDNSQMRTTAEAPVLVPAPASWHTLLEVAGNGIKQSESFRNTARELRLSWESKAEHAGLTIFQIYVHRASDDALVQVAANTAAEGSDSTSLRLTPGEYYLKVNSATKWVVKAEEKR